MAQKNPSGADLMVILAGGCVGVTDRRVWSIPSPAQPERLGWVTQGTADLPKPLFRQVPGPCHHPAKSVIVSPEITPASWANTT